MGKNVKLTEKEYEFLLNCHDRLRDIWNRGYLHGQDDGQKPLVKQHVGELLGVKNGEVV